MEPAASVFLSPVCCSYVLEDRSPFAISLKRANEIRQSVPEVWVMDDDEDLSGAPSGRVKDTALDQSLNVNQLAQRYDGKVTVRFHWNLQIW